MRRTVCLLLLSFAVAAVACSDDGPNVPSLAADYVIQTTEPTVTVAQDSTYPLSLTVTKDGEQLKYPNAATVNVLAASVPMGAPRTGRIGFSPETVHVDAGAKITWRNNTGGNRGVDFLTAPAASGFWNGLDIPQGRVAATTGFWPTGTDSVRTMPLSQRDTIYTYRCGTQCPSADVDARGYIFLHTGPALTYRSDDYSIANVSATGLVTGVRGGTTTIRVTGSGSTLAIPVTVRARPATRVELTFLDPLRLDDRLTEDTVYAQPGDRASSQLRAIVMAGADTVFCNRCANFDSRPQRFVNFRSLDTNKVLVTNTANPLLRPDTTGRMFGRDTTVGNTGTFIVLETSDGLADTVKVHVKLRPIDSLEIRLDSLVDPNNPDAKLRYPSNRISLTVGNSLTPVGVVGLGVTFRAKVQDPPDPRTGILPIYRYIAVQETGGSRRATLPIVSWETANATYADVTSGGLVTGLRADAPNTASLLTCTYVPPAGEGITGRIASAFNGPLLPTVPLPPNATAAMTTAFNTQAAESRYTIPNCTTPLIIRMPGVLCTSAQPATGQIADPTSYCQVWIRATATDPVTGKLLSDKHPIIIVR